MFFSSRRLSSGLSSLSQAPYCLINGKLKRFSILYFLGLAIFIARLFYYKKTRFYSLINGSKVLLPIIESDTNRFNIEINFPSPWLFLSIASSSKINAFFRAGSSRTVAIYNLRAGTHGSSSVLACDNVFPTNTIEIDEIAAARRSPAKINANDSILEPEVFSGELDR